MDTFDDEDLDSMSADETTSTSPLMLPKRYEEDNSHAFPDDSSDCSWEGDAAISKSARKYSRPKVTQRSQAYEEDAPIRKRGVRCMECPACMRKDDCGQCEMCKDKKKFGGPGVKKQACM